MKKLVPIILFLIFLISIPRIIWQIQDGKDLNVLIVDKTVPNTEYREHLGLFWVLTNEKILNKNSELYDIGNDYYGYDPYENKAMSPLEFVGQYDMVYVADTYGVYSDDFEEKPDGDRSELIYGGLDAAEWMTILKSKGNKGTMIAEFNTLGSPTEENIAKMIEKDLSIDWSHWMARYFPDMQSEEVPKWLINNYKAQYQKEWDFQYGGIAFVHTSDKVIVIGEDSEDSKIDVRFIMTDEGSKRFSEVKNSSYFYWFDIVSPTNGASVYANLQIELDEDGRKELEKENISLNVPAIIHHESNNTYYFAGDFSDYPKGNLKKWYKGDWIMRIFSNEDTDFFWATYVPLMKKILEDTMNGV